MSARISALQKTLDQRSILILSRPADITYFSGFSFLVPSEREALLVVTATTAHLLHTSFSPTQKLPGITYHPGCFASDVVAVLQKLTADTPSLNTIAIDEETLFVAERNALSALSQCTIVPMSRQQIWHLRMIKDAHEQEILATACVHTKQAVTALIKELKTGDTEQKVAQNLEIALLTSGAHPLGFPTIVAFGAHTAVPHHQPTATLLTPNTPVLIDAGGTWGGYTADMTRTLWFGASPSAEFLAVERAVHDAYQAVLGLLEKHSTAPAPLTAQRIDQTAREVIQKAGYGSNFIHTSGHGVGLEIHEQPSLSSRNETEITAGMILTIEPGIYLENKFGYRYENTVLITQDGCKELTG